jgi:hypothetical protein
MTSPVVAQDEPDEPEAPVSLLVIAGETVYVGADVGDDVSDVESFRLLLDGKRYGASKGPNTVSDGTVRFERMFSPGTYRLQVAALNAFGQSESEPVWLVVVPEDREEELLTEPRLLRLVAQ